MLFRRSFTISARIAWYIVPSFPDTMLSKKVDSICETLNFARSSMNASTHNSSAAHGSLSSVSDIVGTAKHRNRTKTVYVDPNAAQTNQPAKDGGPYARRASIQRR
jgi:hypothetical protein